MIQTYNFTKDEKHNRKLANIEIHNIKNRNTLKHNQKIPASKTKYKIALEI